MSKTFSVYIIGAIAVISICAPFKLFAAEVTFKALPHTASVDGTTVVEVRIDPESKKLNVVEGTLTLSGPASENLSVQIENGQSILPIWPTAPQYASSTKSVSFTGGIPNGFDVEGLLFRVRLVPAVEGSLTISYTGGNAYLNDGKGTKESISSKPLTLNLDAQGQNVAAKDSSDDTTYTYVIIILLAVIVLTVIFTYGFKKHA